MPTQPTPAEPVDLRLLSVIKQMIADLANPNQHHMVSANYLEFVDQDHEHPRRYIALIYIHRNSARNVAVDPQGLLLDALLSPDKDAPWERIRLPYSQIYEVASNQTGGMFTDEDSVYHEPAKLRMPPLR